MFGIGFYEIVLIAIVAMVVVGPKRLPYALRTVGRAIGAFRNALTELRKEVAFDDVVSEVSRPLREGIAEAHKGIGSLKDDIFSDVPSASADLEYPVGGPDDYGALPEHVTPYAIDPSSAVEPVSNEKAASPVSAANASNG